MEEHSSYPNRSDDREAGLWPVVLAQRPLLLAVCRKYLKGPDVEDAVQETFVRYFRAGRGQPLEVLPAWMSRVAHSVCLDMLRRRGAERRRRERVVVRSGEDGGHDVSATQRYEAISRLLPHAMRQLSMAEQRLVAERFIANLPLRLIAARTNESVPTVSRSVASTLAKLAGVLRNLGVTNSDDSLLGRFFADGTPPARVNDLGPDVYLRATSDRRQLDRRLQQTFGEEGFALDLPPPIEGPVWPGWTRPIRVGVAVLHRTIITYGYRGTTVSGDSQAMSSALLADPRFDLVAIVEPRTSIFGPIEQTIRDYRLTDGLIEANDPAGLATLDVILLGVTVVMTPDTVMAIRTAVARHGVGYLKDGWLMANHLADLPDDASDLLLARPPVYAYHMPGRCGAPGDAVVCGRSPLMASPVGQHVRVPGCGPAFRPLPGATVLMERTRVVSEAEHGMAGVGPLPMPLYLTGHIGRGRAAVFTLANHAIMLRSCFTADYLPRLVAWLAEPRRNLK